MKAPSLPSHFGPALQRYETQDGKDAFQEHWLVFRFGAFGFRKPMAVGIGVGDFHFGNDQWAHDNLSQIIPRLPPLSHPNITRVHEWGVHQGRIYQAHEFCPGVDLNALMELYRKKKRRLPRAIAIWIVQKLCEAADYYHRVQLRTSNDNLLYPIASPDQLPTQVVLSFFGEVKLVGLQSGLLKHHLSRTNVTSRIGPIQGNFSYMSPEQTKGLSLDGRSDIFSFGTLLYTLTTGHQPFQRASPIETLLAIMESKVTAPLRLDPQFCPVLQRVIQKAMLKKPQSRYRTAGEMASTLADYLKRGRAEASTAHFRRFVQACFPEQLLKAKQLQQRFLPQKSTVSDTAPTVELLAPASAPR